MEVAPGSVVRVRDEEWLVTSSTSTASGTLVNVQGLTELVRDTEAAFYSDFDDIEVVDPSKARIVADDTPHYRKSRLFLETTLRKTPLPVTSSDLSVSTQMLADTLTYQQTAVAKALSPESIRPRILIADAVGLGKTLEIGMILSELVARGRGENILIVTPRHVLEQMQHEMWCRFALPFVRLDSLGIQRVRQTIPASRNPFTYFKRAIISIDTLKTPRYREHLRKRRWDAVVIDESHNVTNPGTLNNELAQLLAPRTDALILASATPHNGKKESFAELLRLLDPTVVNPDGSVDEQAVQQLIVRRHRYSDEVAREVGADWAERPEPQNKLIPASPAEDAVAEELSRTWLYPAVSSPAENALFGWTLAKAFLSSPAALVETIKERQKRIGSSSTREAEALIRLRDLAEEAAEKKSAKFTALVDYLKDIGVGRGKNMRAVIFAERVATLQWLQEELPKSLGLPQKAIGLLHGGLSDVEQQEIVEQFKRGSSDLRVLVTGDVASEGVNLHAECHHLVHFDIPWSLIRIEQRNGRIDRFGQKYPPQITTLLLEPSDEKFSGDVRVLTRLVEKEHEAYKILNDVAALMGKNSVEAEEREIRKALAENRDIEEVIPSAENPQDEVDALLNSIFGDDSDAPEENETQVVITPTRNLYRDDLAYLQEALTEAFGDPAQKVKWRVDDRYGIATLRPPADLQNRLRFLPQDYLRERDVFDELKLATSKEVGKRSLEEARKSEDTNWPAAHYLGPLHPVLDWASDKALASLSRNEVLAIRAEIEEPTFFVIGTISNMRGQLLSRIFMTVTDGRVEVKSHLAEFMNEIGFTQQVPNPGPFDTAVLQEELPQVIDRAQQYVDTVFALQEERTSRHLEAWIQRADQWSAASEHEVQRTVLRDRRRRVAEERQLAEDMKPSQSTVRALLAVIPRDHPASLSQVSQ